MTRKAMPISPLLVLFMSAPGAFAQDAVVTSVNPIDVQASIAAEAADAAADSPGLTRAIRLNPEELARTRLPVVAIGTRDPKVRAAPYGMMSLGDSYVLNSITDGSTLSLTGTRLESDLTGTPDNPNFDAADNAEPCHFSVLTEPEEDDEPGGAKEYAADCSWTRFGASYNLRLTCRSGSDTRCTEPTFLQSAASAQIVVKGGM